MWIFYTLYNNYQCIYYEYVCVCVGSKYILNAYGSVYRCYTCFRLWILLLVWLGGAYFGTFIGCWKDKCEVPNNPFLGRRAIGRNMSFHNNSPHQKEDMLNVFAWAGTVCPQHEICQSTRALRSQMLQNVSFVECCKTWAIGPVDFFEKILTSHLWKYCTASPEPLTRLKFRWPKLCQPPLNCLVLELMGEGPGRSTQNSCPIKGILGNICIYTYILVCISTYIYIYIL